ncbi:MAG TPA: VWA domain-containing protein [Thermoanaerobaculia bacterium]|nr:VWA domain-containing protein [Thermoanaerobaculia bacterium]
MKLACCVLSVFCCLSFSILAQTPDPQKTKTPPPQDSGIRKLGRRERKEKIAALPEQYRQFLQDVEPIMMPTELDTFLILETDAQREIYIVEFWRRRDVAAGTTNHAFKDEYYSRLEEAKSRFKYLSSDRGRMYLIHGEPDELLKIDCSRLLVPLEIWKYAYVPGLGHQQRLLFYLPRHGGDYKLWSTMGDQNDALAELVSEEVMGASAGDRGAVSNVFFSSAASNSFVSKIEVDCKDGDEIMKAIFQMQQNRTDLPKVFDPPKIDEESVGKILKSVVLSNPNAPKLAADFSIKYPGKQGGRTDAEMTLMVPKSQLKISDVGGTKLYSIDVTGEVLKEGQLFENYRYRFDYPSDIKDEKLPVVIDRLLRPNDYQSRIKLTDPNGGGEGIFESKITVPELFDTPDQMKAKSAGATTVAQLKDDLETGQTKLRIVPLADDLLAGLQHIETIAVGDNIKAVEFYLDNRKVMVKRQPPYTLDLDFGDVPQARRIRAIALNDKGEQITGDEIVVNTGTDPFRVRIVSPRVALNIQGKTRVEMSVKTPEGKQLDKLELYLNETRVATLYDPPFVQLVDIPKNEGVGYLRVVATLKDDPTPPIEDVVMINTPQYMEEVNVHLIELPTTVIVNGRPRNDLPEAAFKVLDEGKPVKVTKFEHVSNLPLSIGVAIDTSGSMQPRMSEAQKAGASFFQSVMRQGDKAFVVGFSTEPSLIQKWSPRLADVNAGLARLRAEESTALYDAVVYSLYNFLGVRGQKALIVITDGKDTASKFNFDQALEYARRAAVPIYGIGIGIRATEVDVRYKFGRFCSETGGNVYYIDNATDLSRIYNEIQNELRSQYVLGFYPPDGVKPGSKWREVNVQVSEGRAKTIRGYYP